MVSSRRVRVGGPRHGTGACERFAKALRWVRDDKRITTVNLSAGYCRPDCLGHCSLCEAARRVAAAGESVYVVAGKAAGHDRLSG